MWAVPIINMLQVYSEENQINGYHRFWQNATSKSRDFRYPLTVTGTVDRGTISILN